jgi:phenylacetate-CoA ligase
VANRPGEARIALNLLRAQREGAAGLARRQEARLASLVEYARARSPFYRHLYRDQPVGGVVLRDLPPVTKPQLMAAFDDWVTDPAVTRAGVEAFVADPALGGASFLGQYFVCTSSGTTGQPGLFVHDRRAIAVYRALSVRMLFSWLSFGRILGLFRRGARWAVVVGTGGHFGAVGWIESERRRDRWRRRAYRVFSVQQPLAELVAALNDFNPSSITGYPSALELLAGEQAAGRLRVRPMLVELGGESMGTEARSRVAAALGGALHEAYGASEFTPVASDCEHGWLHVFTDWAILEPVDADFRPTPAGKPSHTVLLTNLANRVQPIIRYDLGDSRSGEARSVPVRQPPARHPGRRPA